MRSSSGWSTSGLRTGHGWNSIALRLAAQASTAVSVGQISSAARPLGNRIWTVSTQGGAPFGARFWKKNSPSTPSGYRRSAVGRPPIARSIPSPTAM